MRVLLIRGAIYGASHVHDYTTSWTLADRTRGRPRAWGLAVGVPLTPKCPAPAWPLSNADLPPGPPALKKIIFPCLQLCSYILELLLR